MINRKCAVEGCENEALPNRKICREHRNAQVREYCAKRGTEVRKRYKCKCSVCKNDFMSFRRDSKICSDACRRELHDRMTTNSGKYILSGKRGKEAFEHRVIAKRILNRELASNETIHHIDLNPQNNSLDNLLLLTRSQHGKLHQFLNHHVAELSRDDDLTVGKDIKRTVVSLTHMWSDATGLKLRKLSDF